MPVDPLKRSGCPSPMRPFLLLVSTFLCLMAGRLCADPLDYWTLVNSRTNYTPISGAFGIGRFVVNVTRSGGTGNRSGLWTSNNGKDWRETYSYPVSSLVYANGMFVGYVNAGQEILASTDGETWGTWTFPFSSGAPIVPALGRLWTVVTAGRDRTVLSSVDARIWTSVDVGLSVPRLVLGDESVLVINGLVGTNTVRRISTNGVDFVDPPKSMAAFADLAKIGDTWVGTQGSGSTLLKVSVSTNGTDWTNVPLNPPISWVRVFVRAGRFILVGRDDPFFLESIDGFNWTKRLVELGVEIPDLVYGNDSILVLARQDLATTTPNVFTRVARFHLSRPLTPTLPQPLEASLRPALVLRSGIVGAGYAIESAMQPEGPWIHAATVFPTNFPFSVLVPDGHGERGFFRSVMRDR